LLNLGTLFTAKEAKERKGKQSTSLVIKITNLVIASEFTLALISLASLSVLGGSNAGFRLKNLSPYEQGNHHCEGDCFS
jgi:hypothetical protein